MRSRENCFSVVTAPILLFARPEKTKWKIGEQEKPGEEIRGSRRKKKQMTWRAGNI